MSETKFTTREDGSVYVQRKRVVLWYRYKDGKITFYNKDGTIKDFHFESTNINLLRKMALVYLDIVKECQSIDLPAEIELRGHKYILKEDEV